MNEYRKTWRHCHRKGRFSVFQSLSKATFSHSRTKKEEEGRWGGGCAGIVERKTHTHTNTHRRFGSLSLQVGWAQCKHTSALLNHRAPARLGFKGGSKLGVAEWRLKINQPSLLQFVRKQKWKEIMKKEREMRVGDRQGRSSELAQARHMAISEEQRHLGDTEGTKGTGFFVCLFVCIFAGFVCFRLFYSKLFPGRPTPHKAPLRHHRAQGHWHHPGAGSSRILTALSLATKQILATTAPT